LWDPQIYPGSEIRYYLLRMEFPDSAQPETLQLQARVTGYSIESVNTGIHVMG